MADQYIWERPSNGVREIYELVGSSWILKDTQPIPVAEHSHPEHGDINLIGDVSADGDKGLTGERLVGGYRITFKKGLLVGFEKV